MLILRRNDVLNSLSMAAAIDAMEVAFKALGSGQVEMPVRTHIPIKEVNAEWLVMPSYVGGKQKSLASKMVGVFPENSNLGLEPILGMVAVFDPETGVPLAILDGAAITGIRTAAVSAVATRYLARENCNVLAVIGGGVQARTHIEAMCCVRSVKRLQIFSPTRSKVEQIASDLSRARWAPTEIQIFDSADAAIADADIICACTSANDSVFSPSAVSAGCHINAIGLHSPDKREIPGEIVSQALVVVDQKEVAIKAGDLNIPLKSGLIAESHIAFELGELAVQPERFVRESDQQMTLFKSVGLAMEDAIAADCCLKRARQLGLGQSIAW